MLYHLGDHLQDLVFGLRWSQHSECLQTTKTPQDLPLLLLQSEVAVGDQRLVPLYLLRCSSVLPSSPLNQPIVTGFLLEQRRRNFRKLIYLCGDILFVLRLQFSFFPSLRITQLQFIRTKFLQDEASFCAQRFHTEVRPAPRW